MSVEAGQFVRVAERERPRVALTIDGAVGEALAGDTVLTAILTQRGHIRAAEFDEGMRGGFCLMGACQDCWVALASGERLRACTTLVADGMAIVTVSGPSHG